MFHKIKLLFYGFCFIFLGVASISLKFLLDETARLPFWPFDGIAAILGGAFIVWWSWTIINEDE